MTGPVASMTGYARAERAAGALRARVELKSVNGRGLDLRLRLAPGLEAAEIPLRQALAAALTRGSVTLVATIGRDGAGQGVRLNSQALDAVLAALDRLAGRVAAAPPRLDGILALPGVLELDEGLGADDEEAVVELLLACATEAIGRLQAARREEGARIAAVLLAHVETIAGLARRAADHPARSRAAIDARLREQLAVLARDVALDPDRLAQEVLLLATRADIREELDRLSAHVDAARQLLAEGGPVGRRLDFLAQEFNREANTLCSKSNAVELTAIGLDLKVAIDQLREQVQNIE